MNYTHGEAQQYAKLVVREAEANRFDAPKTEMLAREVIRLNEWADGMTDAALKERATSDAFIKELQAKLSAPPEALPIGLERAAKLCDERKQAWYQEATNHERHSLHWNKYMERGIEAGSLALAIREIPWRDSQTIPSPRGTK